MVTAWVVEIAALYMNCPILVTPTVLYVCIHLLQAAINPIIYLTWISIRILAINLLKKMS